MGMARSVPTVVALLVIFASAAAGDIRVAVQLGKPSMCIAPIAKDQQTGAHAVWRAGARVLLQEGVPSEIQPPAGNSLAFVWCVCVSVAVVTRSLTAKASHGLCKSLVLTFIWLCRHGVGE